MNFSGAVGYVSATVVDVSGDGIAANGGIAGLPANVRAGTVNRAASSRPCVSQRSVIRIAGLGVNGDEFVSPGVNRAGIGRAGDGGRVHCRGRRSHRRISEAEDHAGRSAQVVLAIVAAIGETSQQILELKQTEGD